MLSVWWVAERSAFNTARSRTLSTWSVWNVPRSIRLSTSVSTDMNWTRVTGSPRYSVRRKRVDISLTPRTWYQPSSINGTLIVAFDSVNVWSPYAIFMPFRPIRIRLGPVFGLPLVSPRTITYIWVNSRKWRRRLHADLQNRTSGLLYLPMTACTPNWSRNFSICCPHNVRGPANKPIRYRAIRTCQIPNSQFRCHVPVPQLMTLKYRWPANFAMFHTKKKWKKVKRNYSQF